MRHVARRSLLAALALAACRVVPSTPAGDGGDDAGRLPTGVRLDPAGDQVGLGSMPLSIALAPDSVHAAVVLSGWREQGVQIVDVKARRVMQTLLQPAAFVGAAWGRDGRTLFVSGGNQDVVYRYAWDGTRAALADSVVLAVKPRRRDGTRYPAGLALSPDGATLYVAENLADSLAVVDVASGRVRRRYAAGRYPYDVVVAPDGIVYVSSWGADDVRSYRVSDDDDLRVLDRIVVGRHPSAMLLSRDGARLFVASATTDRVAVVDTRARRVLAQLFAPPDSAPLGSTPNALALAPGGTRLYVAEADNNAIAVWDLSDSLSGVAGARGDDRLAGRVPTGWYPTALLATGAGLHVVTGKGRGTAPNPKHPQPLSRIRRDPHDYTLGQTSGTLMFWPDAMAPRTRLAALTRRVAAANGWTRDCRAPSAACGAPMWYPPFEHVIYVIKENRTYDQVLGDLPQGDGDTALVFFGRANAPNHHALAERFGLYDRFFVNAEVSADGHNWSTAAYAADYVQKTTPSNYSDRGRSYDYEGMNRGKEPEDDAAEPANGYLWDLAVRKGITLRNYGEFVTGEGTRTAEAAQWTSRRYRGVKRALATTTNPDYPPFDLDIPDQRRADVWIAELQEFVRQGRMPALEIVHLPNDHTSGGSAGKPTPRAAMADNDLALGRMVEALSRTPFWSTTVIFVLEDDAQNGPDHVDSHRSPLLVISPWARAGVHHRFANTSDVIATIAEILRLGALTQFDYFGRPLRDVWRTAPDTAPYAALQPTNRLDERNPTRTSSARASERLDFSAQDRADDEAFNRVLWAAVKGDSVPYPGARRMSSLEARRSR